MITLTPSAASRTSTTIHQTTEYENTMTDNRRLYTALAVLLIVAGAIVVCSMTANAHANDADDLIYEDWDDCISVETHQFCRDLGFRPPYSTPPPAPAPDPPADPDALPPCTASFADLPTIERGATLKGCFTGIANLWFGSGISYEVVNNIADILDDVSDAMLDDLGIDLSARDHIAPVYVAYMGEEIDAIKEYHGHEPASPTGWFSSYYGWDEEYWGVYADLHGTWPLETVTHEFIHFAMDNPVQLPWWLNEGMAVYYQIELASENPYGPFDSTGDQYTYICSTKRAAEAGRLKPFTAQRSEWHRQNVYSYGYSFVRYVVDTHGLDTLADVLDNFYDGDGVEDAISQALAMPYADFASDFQEWVLAFGDGNDLYQQVYAGTAGQLHCHDLCGEAAVERVQDPLFDVAIEATFTNPVGQSEFKYGFNLREKAQFRVDDEGTWSIDVWTEDYRRRLTLASGQVEGLDTALGGGNQMRATAQGDQGCIHVNGRLMGCADLPDYLEADRPQIASHHGDVWYSNWKIEALESTED